MLSSRYSLHLVKHYGGNVHRPGSLLETMSEMPCLGNFYGDEDDRFLARYTRGFAIKDSMRNAVRVQTSLVVVYEGSERQNENGDGMGTQEGGNERNHRLAPSSRQDDHNIVATTGDGQDAFTLSK